MLLGTLFIDSVSEQCLDNVLPDKSKGNCGYRNRGQYCEGLVQKLASQAEPIYLVSFTEGIIDSELSGSNIITIETKYSYKPINVRIGGIRSNSYYQLDGTLSYNTPIHWDITKVFKQCCELDFSQIGIYGELQIDSSFHKLKYVPVFLRKNLKAIISNKPLNKNLVFRSSKRYEDIKWKLIFDGKDLTRFESVDKIGLNYFPAEYPIKLTIPDSMVSNIGDYSLELALRKVNQLDYKPKEFLLRFD